MNHQAAKQLRARFSMAEWLVIVMAAVLVLAVCISGFTSLAQRAQARAALANAKAARLALFVVSAEQQAKGTGFADFTQPGGLTPAAQRRVLLLSKVPGEVQLLQLQADGITVERMAYTEGEYLVLYSAQDAAWQVYHNKEQIAAVAQKVYN